MSDSQYGGPGLFQAFIRLAQYIVRLKGEQDICDHVGRFVVTHFPADWTAFVQRDPAHRISVHHCTLPDPAAEQCLLAEEVRVTAEEVLESGFLASQIVSAPTPSMTAFLPVVEERRTEQVLLIGHRAVDPLPKELLDIYLAIAGLTGTACERLRSERELYRHRAHLEELVRERTAKLAKAERQNELILDSVGEGICGTDLAGRITFVNPSAARIVGWEARHLIGRDAHDTFHHARPDGSVCPREECPLHSALQSGRTSGAVAEEFSRQDGSRFPVDVTATPILEGADIVGAVLVFRDVTNRKGAEARALAAERERAAIAERMTAEINHRMKNNLTLLSSVLQLQLTYLPRESAAADAVRDAITRIGSLSVVHEQLYQGHASRVELRDVLRRVAEVGSQTLAARKVEILVSGEDCYVSSKLGSTVAILANELVTNALKYGAPTEHGRLQIAVDVARTDEQLRLRIWNSGNPVPADFDAAGQPGMGLALVQGVVTGQLGGSFTLRPERGGTLAEVMLGNDVVNSSHAVAGEDAPLA